MVLESHVNVQYQFSHFLRIYPILSLHRPCKVLATMSNLLCTEHRDQNDRVLGFILAETCQIFHTTVQLFLHSFLFPVTFNKTLAIYTLRLFQFFCGDSFE